MTKVWITKYAISKGIFTVEGDVSSAAPSMFAAISRESGYSPHLYFHGEGRDWHTTEESAKAWANEMVRKKLLSLRRQITKMEKMKF